MELAHAHTQDNDTHLHSSDRGALSPPATRVNTNESIAPQVFVARCLHRSHVMLGNALSRPLRQARCMSRQDVADDCWPRNIQLSLTSINRTESARVVRFRIAHGLTDCFALPSDRVAQPDLG